MRCWLFAPTFAAPSIPGRGPGADHRDRRDVLEDTDRSIWVLLTGQGAVYRITPG